MRGFVRRMRWGAATRGPSAWDVAVRVAGMRFVVLWGTAAPREMLDAAVARMSAEERRAFEKDSEQRRDHSVRLVQNLGLWKALSPRERAILQSTLLTLTPQMRIDATWRLESIAALMWSLRMLQTLPDYGVLQQPEVLKQIPLEGLRQFAASATLRGAAEIERARAVAELWHWRSRTREMMEAGEPFPADAYTSQTGATSFDDVIRISAHYAASRQDLSEPIDGDFPVRSKAYRDLSEEEWTQVRSMTIERHRAFNWLCGKAPGNRWDETRTDT